MDHFQIMTDNIAGYEVNFRRRLGKGAIGLVYMAKDRDGGTIVAKQVDRTRSEKAAVRELQSAQRQSKLNHENIVKIFKIYNEDDIWVFMEYIVNGDLNSFSLNYYSKLQQSKIDIMTQICSGLEFLHNSKICHRDIKPENILIQYLDGSKQVTAKLTDFGLAKFGDPDDTTSAMHTKLGTQNYMAPEFFIVQPDGNIIYHKSVDIFAVGLTFLSILQAEEGKNLRPMAEGCKQAELGQAIGIVMSMRHQNGQSQLVVTSEKEGDDYNTKVVKDLIRWATLFQPNARPSAHEMLQALQVTHIHAIAFRSTLISKDLGLPIVIQ